MVSEVNEAAKAWQTVELLSCSSESYVCKLLIEIDDEVTRWRFFMSADRRKKKSKQEEEWKR